MPMRGSVLIVDGDQKVSGLVAEFLTTEGFSVSELVDQQPVSIAEEVARLEPDVVLLDGGDRFGYGPAWQDAAWLHERDRPIAVIMFTAHAWDLAEAQLGQSERSHRAAFEGFVSKPFELDVLVSTVEGVIQHPPQLGTRSQKTATGLTGEPVALESRRGRMLSANSQRWRV